MDTMACCTEYIAVYEIHRRSLVVGIAVHRLRVEFRRIVLCHSGIVDIYGMRAGQVRLRIPQSMTIQTHFVVAIRYPQKRLLRWGQWVALMNGMATITA